VADAYTSLELFFYLGGFLLWGAAYGSLLVRVHRHRFVEIAAAGRPSTGPSAGRATTSRSAATRPTS